MNWIENLFSTILDQLKYIPEEPMLFNSGLFLVLFTLFITGYAFLYDNQRARTGYILAFSLYFYYKSSGWYLLILVFSILLDFFVAHLIYHSRHSARRKGLLTLSMIISVAVLGYFKYTNFLLTNISLFTEGKFQVMDIFLPIGISFYTFQSISYVVDVYKGTITPSRNIIDYAFYMSFFPHLVAGPIVRANDFLPQIHQKMVLTSDKTGEGMYMIVKGLIKKAIIADYVAQYADLVFSMPEGYSGFENLVAIYAYTLQIYCDFSGYSDMAIGLAKLMGFELGENFRTPYESVNITEFWRRWHISLSSWLRDYVYIPLGGNRKGLINQYLFLLLTMLIGGLWHGPSWKFVFWGGMHGVGLVVHKWYRRIRRNESESSSSGKAFSWLITFHFVAFLWVFFRADSFSTAILVLQKALFATDFRYLLPFLKTHFLLCLIMAAGYASHFLPSEFKANASYTFSSFSLLIKAAILLMVIQLILQVKTESVQPFIYFQF